MSIETVLYDRLTNHVGLEALISSRCYPLVLPQCAVLPAISYSRVSTVRNSAMGVDIQLVAMRLQVSVWASSFSSAITVAAQVRAALQRWSTTTGTVIQDIFYLNETDLHEPQTGSYHIACDFEVHYEE